MTDSFVLNGKLFMSKKNPKYPAYEEKYEFLSKKGVLTDMRTLRLCCSTEAGMQFLKLGYAKKSDGSSILYFTGPNNQRINIKFNDRLKPEMNKGIPSHQKYVVDLEENPKRRQLLRGLVRKNEDGKIIAEAELKQAGVESVEELNEALNRSYALRKEFLSSWDFMEYLKKVLESGKFKDTNFKITGRIVPAHFGETDIIDFEPRTIVINPEESPEPAQAMVQLFFSKDGVYFNEKEDRFEIDGFISYYAKECINRTAYAPYSIIVPIKDAKGTPEHDKRKRLYERMFETKNSDEVRSINLVCDLINGSIKKKITLEDLDDFTREMIELGELDFEEVASQLGGSVRGETIRANVFKKLQASSSFGSVEEKIKAHSLGYVLEGEELDMEDLPF